MKDYFKEILKYSNHFNLEIIKRFNDDDLHLAIPENSVRLFSHVLNAQAIWNDRIEGKKDQVDVWNIMEKDEMKEMEMQNFEKSLELLESNDLDKVITYQNSKGEKFQNSVKDILFHVVNHSTYHRGQIAVDFRNSGLEPIVSDFVYYKRNG